MVGELIVYDYAAAAVSCCMNGVRIRGVGKVTLVEDDVWLVIDGRTRVMKSEISMRGTHVFEPDESGYGCSVCKFSEAAEVHGGS